MADEKDTCSGCGRTQSLWNPFNDTVVRPCSNPDCGKRWCENCSVTGGVMTALKGRKKCPDCGHETR